MIAITLSGGIGNQLFMYATARAMALRNKTGLVINNSADFARDMVYHRNYELGVFNIQYKKNSLLTFDYPGGNLVKKISRRVGRNILCPTNKYIFDELNNRGYNPCVLSTNSSNVYLEGYWHSEKYFIDFEKQIREDLTFDFKKSDILLKEEKEIFDNPNITPVCIGIRRYEEAPNSQYFNLTEGDYYQRAMDYMFEHVNNPVFFVFTQAKKWVEDNIVSPKYDIRFISEKQNNGTIEDLYLMSKFKYHIISNSSYYWWGAWLAKGDVVVSCKNWFNSGANCESWIVI